MQEKTGSERRIFLSARLFLCFLGARILFALPLFLPLGLSFWLRLGAKLALCLILALLVCGPERLVRASVLAREAKPGPAPRLTYPEMIKRTAVRLLRVSPFLIPFLTASVLIYYSICDDEMNLKAMRTLKNIGDALKSVFMQSSRTPGYDIGCAALLIAAVFFMALAALWWHWDVPMDYGWRPRTYRRKHAPVWRKTSWVNFLLGFPAYLLWLTALVLSYRSLQTGGRGGLFNAVLESRRTIGAMLQNRELLVYLVLILLLVYLPCWCLRKWRLSGACAGGPGDAA